jgi:zinc-ribbon domain
MQETTTTEQKRCGGIMVDPEIPNDEKVLMRTQGVHVKSIPFEGILTNRRIILVDRAKNLLPPKEIPLATVRDVETGENAIRDLTLTISIMAKTGETRQMILTFSRQEGGNRIRERDEWARLIRESTSTSFEQVIRKVIPGADPAQRQPEPAAPYAQSPQRTQPKMMIDGVHPIKKIIETAPAESPVQARSPAQAAPSPAAPATGEMVFCTRCGNKVSADSAFCNKCGSPVVVPAGLPRQPAPRQTAAPVPQPAPSGRATAETVRTIPRDVPPPQSLGWDDEREQAPAPVPLSRQAARKPEKKGFLAGILSPRKQGVPPAKAPAAPASQKKRRGSMMPGKKTLIAGFVVLVVIVALVIGAVFVYPMVTSGNGAESSGTTGSSGTSASGSSGSTGSSASTTGVLTNTGIASITVVATQAPDIPQTGVQVHISYIGGWTGSYGVLSDLQKLTWSGDRVEEIVNATGVVQASFAKQDSSKHTLTVEIYKNGKLITSDTTSDANGKVTVSADATTGTAISGNPAGTAPATTANAGNTTAAPQPTAVVTTAKTTAPVATTT